MFRRLAANTSGLLILGKDDANLAECAPGKAVTFSVELPSDYQARDVQLNPLSTTFSVRGCEFQLSLPGRHNLYNALACIALLSEMGIEPGRVAEILPCFTGIERRFDVYLNDGRHLVVDDYAHNPHKISSLIQTMRRIGGTTCYLFQPHGYGPTRLMKEGYIEAFSENLGPQDRLILLPIFYAGGTAAKDISSHDLARGISEGRRSAEAVDDRSVILKMELTWDNYVVLGARDDSLADLAGMLAERLR
jgi:UDP-N-acetylmuramate--alanine ligase